MASRFDGASRAGSYDDKWQRMAAAGENPHGEVDFVMRYEPTSVLDAGCGTGRVAIELDRRGIEAAGTDIDATMLAKAADKAPHLRWELSNLAALELARTFDLVVMAGKSCSSSSPAPRPRSSPGRLAMSVRAGISSPASRLVTG